ncbi:MAG: hypothetical protein HQ559_12235 [Lentisphaerae bacterium]|nr:hypothetical protein [Lentisphaerota bacterium]
MKDTIRVSVGGARMRIAVTVAAVTVFAAFFLVLGHNMESAAYWRPTRRALQSPAVPSPLLEYGALGGLLRRHNLVTSSRNDGSIFPLGTGDATVPDLTPFQKKRRAGAYLLRANRAGAAGIPSSSAAVQVRGTRGSLVCPSGPNRMRFTIRRRGL